MGCLVDVVGNAGGNLKSQFILRLVCLIYIGSSGFTLVVADHVGI